jgi:hypothetical protein
MLVWNDLVADEKAPMFAGLTDQQQKRVVETIAKYAISYAEQ